MRKIRPSDSKALADLHACAFREWWTDIAFFELVFGGAFGLMTDDGFILLREGGGEAEILTLAVAPEARRTGLGRRLVEAGAKAAAARGAQTLFLEVAADNDAALHLYRSMGFEQTGLRKAYYRRSPLLMIDALIFARALNSRPPFGL